MSHASHRVVRLRPVGDRGRAAVHAAGRDLPRPIRPARAGKRSSLHHAIAASFRPEHPTNSIWTLDQNDRVTGEMRRAGSRVILSGLGGDQVFWSQPNVALLLADFVADRQFGAMLREASRCPDSSGGRRRNCCSRRRASRTGSSMSANPGSPRSMQGSWPGPAFASGCADWRLRRRHSGCQRWPCSVRRSSPRCAPRPGAVLHSRVVHRRSRSSTGVSPSSRSPFPSIRRCGWASRDRLFAAD